MGAAVAPIVIRQRWTPWWIGAPILLAYVVLAWLLFREFGAPGEMVRVIVPAFVVLGFLVLPAALNARIINVGSHGVKVTNGPFPRGRKVNLAREDIRYCNVRVQYSTFVNKSGASATIDNYLVGVETRTGQVDIAYPYLKAEEAEAVVERIAAALNQDGMLRHIPIARATQAPQADAGWRMKVLGWGGVFVLAIIVGAIWESY